MKLFILTAMLTLLMTGQAYAETPVAGISVSLENTNLSPTQAYINHYSKQYGVDADLITAIIGTESGGEIKAFNINKNGTHDKGLMQINSCNHEWLAEELGITDFYNPRQNIHCGAYMIAGLMDRHTDLHTILMAYNMGEKRTRELHREGIYTSKYSRKVMGVYKKLKEVKG